MAKTTPKDGSVILADEQYAGRGQAGSSWEADPLQNLTFSIIYHTEFLPAAEQFYLNMAISLGLQEAVADCMQEAEPGSKKVSIKWPNDIYVNNLKIAGILIENIIQGTHLTKSVIGIGLNVNQDHFLEPIRATSLKLENSGESDRMEVLRKILERIEYHFLEMKKGNYDELRNKYLGQLYRFGEWQNYSDKNGNFMGRIAGVNNFGNLIIETGSDTREYGMKEVEYR